MLTKRQIDQRKTNIGASEMSAICGLSPFSNAYDVWARKTNLIPTHDISDHEAIQIGNALEPAMLPWLAGHLGPIDRRGLERRVPGTHLLVHLDAKTDTGQPIEIKTTGFVGPIVGDWGEDGTDQIPPWVCIQVQTQMMAVDSPDAYVGAWLGHRGRHLYHLPRSEKLCQIIAERARAFWKCIESGTPPADSLISTNVAKQIDREEWKCARIDTDLMDEWRACNDAKKAWTKREELAKRKILTAMGTAQIGDAGGSGIVTYRESQVSTLDREKLKKKFPDAWSECLTKVPRPIFRYRRPGKTE